MWYGVGNCGCSSRESSGCEGEEGMKGVPSFRNRICDDVSAVEEVESSAG